MFNEETLLQANTKCFCFKDSFHSKMFFIGFHKICVKGLRILKSDTTQLVSFSVWNSLFDTCIVFCFQSWVDLYTVSVVFKSVTNLEF